jgi:plasmid stability protein
VPNLTITADEEILRWARIRAAEKNTSVARFVGDLLRQHMETEGRYEAARRRFMGRKPKRLSRGPYPSRDELHDRARLR